MPSPYGYGSIVRIKAGEFAGQEGMVLNDLPDDSYLVRVGEWRRGGWQDRREEIIPASDLEDAPFEGRGTCPTH